MRSLDQWFSEYAVSHQNKTNQLIHYICVPAIFFSIVGLLMSIPPGPLTGIFPMYIPFLENWAVVVLLLVLLFYMRLSVSMGIKILIFAALCIAGNYYISQFAPLWLVSLIIFVVAWIGQFYGHKVEGKKPSFLKDLQFLLIGPAWVIKKVFG
ncbi:Mpo1 family 2-hydroxy fatty acid dioxygenase [Salinimicrobium xinjiangense]|uniref:Mpo1 family 2-hydroxy fatty acid dioxygenase n=1 Tax=Salinimicrobium xinjiangense TaxID=438596 RepID=UPI000427C76B|nr:Mpo1-like protein [Salinimicrobium xinjiangense]